MFDVKITTPGLQGALRKISNAVEKRVKRSRELLGEEVVKLLEEPYPKSKVPVATGHYKAGFSTELTEKTSLRIKNDQDYGIYLENAPSDYRQSQDRSQPVRGSVELTLRENLEELTTRVERRR